MYNKSFRVEGEKSKGDTAPIKNNPNKAFIEKLKKQLAPDEFSSQASGEDSSDGVVFSEDLMRELEVKSNKF